jgi:catechol 2,3-dioxygenase-like lactoylglutathione lyase family enzyme
LERQRSIGGGCAAPLADSLAAELEALRRLAIIDTGIPMTPVGTKPRLTALAPQFLVEDLARSIAYYRKIGFTFGEAWDGFYAIGNLDGLELHLKEAPRNADERAHRRANEHLDAAGGVDGIEAFYAQCVAKGATIFKPLTATPWGTKDFYIEDPDGYIVSFGGRPAAA